MNLRTLLALAGLSFAVAAQTQAPAPVPATAPAPEKKPLLAEDVYKNVISFRGKKAERLLPAMQAYAGLLGVQCEYCHTPKEWERDDKPAKVTMRKMIEMQAFILDTYFAGENKITCWTCHAGVPVPPVSKADDAAVANAAKLINLSPDLRTKPAEQVFKNVQSFKGLPAGQFAPIMAYFTTSLGVPCTHCHVQDQYDKDDKPTKQTARKMLTMVSGIMNRYYGGSGTFGCPTCHRGHNKPEALPPG
jgi:hypothetical protein